MRLKGRLEAVAELITCSGPAWSSAADLKFLHRLRQTHFRNFKSKSGTRIICLLVPLLLPKFVSEGAAMYHELRKRGTSGTGGPSWQGALSRLPRRHRIPHR